MPGLLKLSIWWISRLRLSTARNVQLWKREPEWPLLIGSAVLFTSFLLHWIGYRLAFHQIPSPVSGAPIFQPTRRTLRDAALPLSGFRLLKEDLGTSSGY
eukprot:s4905_g1.t1